MEWMGQKWMNKCNEWDIYRINITQWLNWMNEWIKCMKTFFGATPPVKTKKGEHSHFYFEPGVIYAQPLRWQDGILMSV